MLGRILLILGMVVVVALFAALIVPFFIDWDNYKETFQREAEPILGQPVHVTGKAEARLLPSPSVTFDNVEVGDREGKPMMTIGRFTATLELISLLQGYVYVVGMSVERPEVNVSIDDAGNIDWLNHG